MTTARPQPKPRGIVLRAAFSYDLLLFILSLGRESALREKGLRLARLKPGQKVLDVGCGTGTTAIAAKRQVGPDGSITGIDASPEMLARAAKKAAKAALPVEFRQASVEALPFANGSFDVVLSTMMLHHLPQPVRRECFAEIRRVLKPGGRLLAIDFGTSPHHAKGFAAHFHRHGHISLSEMESLSQGAGLELVESGPVGIVDLQYVLSAAPAANPGEGR